MKVDWFLFFSQVVNFLILVALLKHFLYNRIVNVMDEREENIASRLDEADSKKTEADEEFEKYQKKKQELDEKETQILNKAKEESDRKKKELLQTARKEVESVRSKWKKSVEQERRDFLSELRKKVAGQVYSISRRVLQDLSNKELEDQVIQIFLKRIEQLDDDEKKELVKLVQKSEEKIVINSSFELDNTIREKLTDIVKEVLSKNAKLNFDVTKNLICGIELKLNGKKVGWNVDDYLSDLEENFNQAFRENEVKDQK